MKKKTLVQSAGLAALSLVMALCLASGCNDDDSKSGAKALTAFSFTATKNTGNLSEDVNATTITDTAITLTVPYGTTLTSLIASFTTTGTSVTVDGAAQTSGVTPNNFTSPVTYTVTAEDGTTADYTVTVTVGADTTAPTIVSVDPADNASVVEGFLTLKVTFSEPMDTDTMKVNTTDTTCSDTFQVSRGDDDIYFNFSSCLCWLAQPTASEGDTVFTMISDTWVTAGETYKVRVTTAAKDKNGNALAEYTQATGFTVTSP